MHREMYIVELAQTVNIMFGDGKLDPSAEEIAETHFEGKALGGEIVEGIRKRLQRIRDVLDQDFGHPVYLLNRRYYTVYRVDQPKTEAEARGCIPGGNGVSAHGIRLHTSDKDLIWQAMTQQNLISGAGKVKKSVDRTLEAVSDSRLSKGRAARLLDDTGKHMAPDNPALAAKVRKALPR